MEYLKLWAYLSIFSTVIIGGLWVVGNLGPGLEQPAVRQIVPHRELADWEGPHISRVRRPPYYPNQ